ncbi:MAG: alpha-glucuronidase [Oscillospiraceae bacterium]|jgi:alpha-glucuronidase|nr:alpha-glucuronidase [Oscillospiraceae bacterium]
MKKESGYYAWLGEVRQKREFARVTDASLPPDAYRITGGGGAVTIASSDAAGAMYGEFAAGAQIRLGVEPATLDVTSVPAAKYRVLNHWDNMDGTVERGYAGRSLFFRNSELCYDAERIEDYARLLASVGINGICLNNVNLRDDSRRLITDEKLPQLAELAAIFRKYHVRLIIAVDFAAPKTVGGLSTSDPLDGGVIAWWRDTAARVYGYIPDLLGFLVKADSEFQSGPAALGRTQADGANVLAGALAPYGGTVFWRCFVYNCLQDWRDTVTDRPKAAYDHFFPLDGTFADNVVLQVKVGPVDFQVYEPLSPLLGALKNTRRGLELQVTQEYTGQQIDLYATAIPWERALSSHVSETRTLSELFGGGIDTVVGVSNAGDDENWTGNPLAQANLYAFGRLAWNPRASAGDILRDWSRLTFGNASDAAEPIADMLLQSTDVYAKYNAPLGIGWMVTPGHHYGVNIDGYEFSKWGTYHRAAHDALGVDRTSRGTGLTAQYDPWVAAQFEDARTCPEELLLFFHRLPYTFRLKGGVPLIQHIYDTHFDGADGVARFIETWDALRGKVPDELHSCVAERLNRQLENAVEWRDIVNTYFHRLTGIPDEKGRQIWL